LGYGVKGLNSPRCWCRTQQIDTHQFICCCPDARINVYQMILENWYTVGVEIPKRYLA